MVYAGFRDARRGFLQPHPTLLLRPTHITLITRMPGLTSKKWGQPSKKLPQQLEQQDGSLLSKLFLPSPAVGGFSEPVLWAVDVGFLPALNQDLADLFDQLEDDLELLLYSYAHIHKLFQYILYFL